MMSQADADKSLLLQPGTLWKHTVARTQHGLACGALQPMETVCEFIEQAGVHFLVRSLVNRGRQHFDNKAKRTADVGFNPFLPYDEDLFVTDISATHLCLLNKFNVLDHHLLVVTRDFEEQEKALTWRDFHALSACMAEINGLAFYNSGPAAGASQQHKHLQFAPLPLAPTGPPIPMEPALHLDSVGAEVSSSPDLPFVHSLVRLDPDLFTAPATAADALFEYYNDMLQAVNVQIRADKPSSPYNLLVTQQWMLLVPRTRGAFDSIAINSLGFAGLLLAKNAQSMQKIKAHGPITVLRNVSVSS
jgi:ATP adenylyltransferase